MPKVKIISVPQFIHLEDGGKIPLVFKDGRYYTTDAKYIPAFKKWAGQKGFKSIDEVSEYLNGGKKRTYL